MKILIDMNLSPDWIGAFAVSEIESVHWSAVGDARAEGVTIPKEEPPRHSKAALTTGH
jgi:predicted nuclease of predicted toxin-antitoxin system